MSSHESRRSDVTADRDDSADGPKTRGVSCGARELVVVFVLAAVACGALTALPHLIGMAADGGHYTPFAIGDAHIIVFDETVAYAVPTRTAVEGAPLSRAPQGPERFDGRGSAAQALGRLFPTAIMSALTHIAGVDWAFILADALFPALSFLLLFLFARALGLSRLGALSAATIVLLGDQILDLPVQLRADPEGAIRHTILAIESPRPLEFSRTWVPQLSYAVLVAAIWGLWCCMTKEGAKWPLLTGVLLALNAYTYAYSWPVVFGGAVILALVLWATDRRAAGRIILGVAAATLLASPVLIEVLRGSQGADMLRYGWGTSGLVWGAQKPRLLLTAALLVAYPWHREERPLVHAFLIIPWICALGSTLAGVMLQDWHWIQRAWKPWTLFVGLAAIDLRWQPMKTGKIVFFVILVASLTIHAGNRQYQSAQAQLPAQTLSSHEADAMRWLENAASTKAMIVASKDWNARGRLPVHSRAGIYTPFGPMTPMETSELLRRLAHIYAAHGYSEAETQAVIADPNRALSWTATENLPYYWTITMAREWGPLTEHDRDSIREGWTAAQNTIEDDRTLPESVHLLWVRTADMPIPLSEHWSIAYQNPTITILKAPLRQ
jgi:hypothetical protein